jgi:hypothetical protein
MRDTERAASLQNFIDELNELYQRAGPPKLSRLRRLSEQVVVGQGVTGLRVLAESTTSDILSGKRSRFPEWPWVASFVTACWMAATETAIDPGQLGSVEEWRMRFRKAREEAGHEIATPPVPVITAIPREPVPRETLPERLPPAELTPTLRRFLNTYGRTGGRLLRHAEAGDAESAFRLGVLLLCDDRPREATEWLRKANRAGHDTALELQHQPDQRGAAVQHALRIGGDYEAAGNFPAAALFRAQAGLSVSVQPAQPGRHDEDDRRDPQDMYGQHNGHIGLGLGGQHADLRDAARRRGQERGVRIESAQPPQRPAEEQAEDDEEPGADQDGQRGLLELTQRVAGERLAEHPANGAVHREPSGRRDAEDGHATGLENAYAEHGADQRTGGQAQQGRQGGTGDRGKKRDHKRHRL